MPKVERSVAHPSNESGEGFVWDWSETAKNEDFRRLTPRASQVRGMCGTSATLWPTSYIIWWIELN